MIIYACLIRVLYGSSLLISLYCHSGLENSRVIPVSFTNATLRRRVFPLSYWNYKYTNTGYLLDRSVQTVCSDALDMTTLSRSSCLARHRVLKCSHADSSVEYEEVSIKAVTNCNNEKLLASKANTKCAPFV